MNVTAEDIIDAYRRGEINSQQALYLILVIRMNELYPWLPPDDPFDITQWTETLSPEARDALQALCSG